MWDTNNNVCCHSYHFSLFFVDNFVICNALWFSSKWFIPSDEPYFSFTGLRQQFINVWTLCHRSSINSHIFQQKYWRQWPSVSFRLSPSNEIQLPSEKYFSKMIKSSVVQNLTVHYLIETNGYYLFAKFFYRYISIVMNIEKKLF